jgi:hypothetical protein
LKPVNGDGGFDDYTFLFQNLYASQPNQGVLLELNSVRSNRKAATKIIFYKQIFPCLKNFI